MKGNELVFGIDKYNSQTNLVERYPKLYNNFNLKKQQ